jgi:adenylate kinase family enzyme
MQKQVYIFIGQSGSGKGTQAKLLEEKIKNQNIGDTFRIETGSIFRHLIKKDNFIAKRTKEMIDEGKLPPSFLGIHAWSHALIEGYTGDQHVFIDGTPRIVDEIPALLSLFEFLNWYPNVINIDVGDEWSHDRLIARGRTDDKEESDVWSRIQWFHQSVAPAIELLKNSPRVTVHHIFGEQTIEKVHQDICISLDLH